MSTTINQRLQQVIQALDKKPNSFAESIEKTPTAIYTILNGRNKPGYDILEAILLKYPTINPGWLLTGEGEMFRLAQKPVDGGAFGEQVIADMAKGYDNLKHVFEEELRAKNRQIENLQELLKMQMAARSFLKGVPAEGRIVPFSPMNEKATA